MLSKLFLLLFLALGSGAGIAAAMFMAPPSESDAKPGAKLEPEAAKEPDAAKTEYVKLNNQFVVPVVQKDRIASLVVVSLSLEAKTGTREAIYAREPKLRDVFLQVLFDHANMGGFDGAFTKSDTLDLLRTALREVAQREMGEDVVNVLIVDIIRQDS